MTLGEIAGLALSLEILWIVICWMRAARMLRRGTAVVARVRAAALVGSLLVTGVGMVIAGWTATVAIADSHTRALVVPGQVGACAVAALVVAAFVTAYILFGEARQVLARVP